jgi:hypothetical protein
MKKDKGQLETEDLKKLSKQEELGTEDEVLLGKETEPVSDPTGEELSLLPSDLSIEFIFSHLSLREFYVLRAVSKGFKAYMEKLFNAGLGAKWFKAEFPRAEHLLKDLTESTYATEVKRNYHRPLYWSKPSHPICKPLQAFFCGGYEQFFAKIDALDIEDQNNNIHAGFSMGFFLLHIASTRNSDNLLSSLNERAWVATNKACHAIGTKVGFFESVNIRGYFYRSELDFNERYQSEPVAKAFEVFKKSGDFNALENALKKLSQEQKLQFLVGIDGTSVHLLHKVFFQGGGVSVAKNLIKHLESLFKSDRNYFHYLDPEHIRKINGLVLRPLFFFVATGKNSQFEELFKMLTFSLQCHFLTYYREDNMTLTSLAARNGNLDFLRWINNFIKNNRAKCDEIMDVELTFGEEPLIEAWNGGHHDCADFLLETYPELFSTNSCYRNIWEDLEVTAIADLDLSTKVLRRYIKKRPPNSGVTLLHSFLHRIYEKKLDGLIPKFISLCSLFDEHDSFEKKQVETVWERIIRTHFSSLCKTGELEPVQWMLDSGHFDPYNKSVFCSASINPLCAVAHRPDPEILARMLIDLGCPTVISEKRGVSPLHAACKTLNLKLLGILLEEKDMRGVDIGINFKSTPGALSIYHLHSPLHTAIEADCENIPPEQKPIFIQTLIKHGADVQDPELLSYCNSEKLSPEVLELILKSYADAKNRDKRCNKIKDDYGHIPLYSLIHSYINGDNLNDQLRSELMSKFLILLQYGSDPYQCITQRSFSLRGNGYPISISWPKEIKELIIFCCDFRAQVLKGARLSHLIQFQKKNPTAFAHLARGIIEDTLFIDPKHLQAVQPLKQLLKDLILESKCRSDPDSP